MLNVILLFVSAANLDGMRFDSGHATCTYIYSAIMFGYNQSDIQKRQIH